MPGIRRFLAMGMAWLVCLGLLASGEAGRVHAATADSLVSLRRNACISIGGEVRVDFSSRTMKTESVRPGVDSRTADLSLRHTNLRLQAELQPHVKAFFKINLSPDDEPGFDDDILGEAMLVMEALNGSGLEFYAGVGAVPYGQDVTIGMLQSYHHAANRGTSSEGDIFIIDPPDDDREQGRSDGRPLPPMRPGRFDQAFLAGAAYQRDDRWRVELAAFQPDSRQYEPRLRDQYRRPASGSDIGFAGRVWFSPVEDLTLEASAMAAHSTDMGNAARRTDLRPGARARKNAYAVSLGFDWRRGPWRVFGEYQHGWDWNFSKDYDTDTWQIGLARELGGGWRVGGMAESLRIEDPLGKKTVDDFYKLSFNVKYVFSSGLFVLAEYGHEWLRRTGEGRLTEKRRGTFLGMRLGFTF